MTIQIDHMSLNVEDFDKARKFYAAALAPLRIKVLMEFPMDNGTKIMGLGADGKPFLWIAGGQRSTPRVHIAFSAESRDQVDAFYAAAMAAGATDNGPPGLRPHYHKTYYAAFVLDPEGHNIEAVTHAPAKAAKRAAAKRSAKPARKPAKAARAKPNKAAAKGKKKR